MWKDIFFVSNLAGDGNHICMGWGWYLQVDFQLFLMGLLLLFLYRSYPKVSVATTWLLTVASLVYNLIYTYHYHVHIANDMEGPNENNGKYFHDIYVQAWGRCPPYFIGLLFGIAYMNYRSTIPPIQQLSKPESLHKMLGSLPKLEKSVRGTDP